MSRQKFAVGLLVVVFVSCIVMFCLGWQAGLAFRAMLMRHGSTSSVPAALIDCNMPLENCGFVEIPPGYTCRNTITEISCEPTAANSDSLGRPFITVR